VTETRSRRRGAALEQAILDATWSELVEVGYNALTIEAVAARAATSKPVIYRRWPSRAELVLASWLRNTPVYRDPPDTGELRSDLLALFHRILYRIDGMSSEVMAGVMGEAFRHPEVTAVLREKMSGTSPSMQALETIVSRAVERGEVPPIKLTPRIARLPLDLIRSEAIVYHCVPTEDTITEILDEVFLPLLHGLASS